MPRKTQTKADPQLVITKLQKDLLRAASTKENQQTLIEQNAHDIKFFKNQLESSVTTMNEAVAKMWETDKEVHALTQETKRLDGELASEQRFTRALHKQNKQLLAERDRARAALVEASMNTSRLVEAVEPRNLTASCS